MTLPTAIARAALFGVRRPPAAPVARLALRGESMPNFARRASGATTRHSALRVALFLILALTLVHAARAQSDPIVLVRPDFQNQLYLAAPTNAPGTSLAQPVAVTLTSGSIRAAGGVSTPNDGSINLVQSGVGQAFFTPAASNLPPAILVQVSNQVFFANSNASVTVFASGTEPVSYQWYRDGIAVAGGTNATLSFPSIQTTNLGNYTAVISNSLGAVTSAVAAVSVIPQGLDTTFGNGGKVITSIGVVFGGAAYGVAVLPDGRIVAAGHAYNGTDQDIAVARYLPDGNLDTNFNGSGYVTTAVGDSSDYGFALALQPDGKIVVAGRTDNTNGGGSSDFCVVRYMPNGRLDTNFGGTGIVTTHFDGGDGIAYGVVVQPDGKIVVAGAAGGDLAVVRYNTDGSLDTGFNGNGKAVYIFAPRSNRANSVALQPDGKIVIAGSALNSVLVARLQPDGSLDTSFNGSGIATTSFIFSLADEGRGIALQRDGRIVVTGKAEAGGGSYLGVLRYNTDGTLDSSFGSGGRLTSGGFGAGYVGQSVIIQLNGKIVVGGYAGFFSQVSVLRFDTNGSPDLSFNNTGEIGVNFGGSSLGRSVTLQSDGKIVIAGNVTSGGFALARLESSEPLSPVPPSIFDQPENRLAYWGVGVAFSVTASGPFLSYQWRKDGLNLAGATNATLALAAVQLSSAGHYDVVITNSYGSVTSVIATLTVPSLLLANQGRGTVVIDPQQGFYSPGQSITLTATPRNTNWTRFLRWSDGGTNATRTITVGFTNQFTAIFTNVVAMEELPFALWQRTFGGNDVEYGKVAVATPDGGFLVGGTSYSNASSTNGNRTSPNVGNGTADYWIVKLDAAGNIQWDRAFGGIAQDFLYGISVTPDGGYILAGESTSDPGGNKTGPRYGGADCWVVKLDASGNKQWDRSYGGNGSSGAYVVHPTSEGGYIIGGYSAAQDFATGGIGNKTAPNRGLHDIWIIKTDAQGNMQWDRTFGGGREDGFAQIRQTADGGYFIGGNYRVSPASGRFWSIKLDGYGNTQWSRDFTGSDPNVWLDSGTTAEPLADGGYFIGGAAQSGAGNDKSDPRFGDYDWWFLRLDAAGAPLWNKAFGGSREDWLANALALADGGFVLAGHSASTDGNKLAPGYGSNDFWVVRLDANGGRRWETSFGGDDDDQLKSVVGLADGGLLLTGHSFSPAGGNKTAPKFGLSDYWVVRMATREAPVGRPVVLVNGQFSPSNFFTIPATNTITVEIQTTFANASVFYTLDDSDPSSGELYGGPLVITNSVLVRVIAFNEDFSESQVGDPVRIDVVPLYPLALYTAGGGSIIANPPSGPHLSNSVVRLTATPLAGWSFLHWTNDATGTNPVLDVIMDRAKTVQAVFGSGLSVTVTGNGTVQRTPTQSLYPFGTTVRLTPIPSAANTYFRQWGSAAAGQFVAPLSFVLTNPNLTVSAIFAVLTGTQRSLTVNISGEGTVTKSPQQSNYANNASVTLTAAPAPGYVFATWSGDSNITSNPLTLVMNTNKAVTANFTVPPIVTITGPTESALLTTADFPVTIAASDADGSVAKVDLFDGSRFIATRFSPPFDFVLNNAIVGAHTLRALATDNFGAMASNQVNVTVSVPPPIISSFSPQTGPIGSVVTIAGANFAANPTDNIVYFGGVRAAMLGGTTNSLTVTVPTGPAFATLSVTAHGLTAYSMSPFGSTFSSTHVVDAGTFAPKSDLNCGGAPSTVALGDLDGDGKLDIVVTSAVGFDGYLSVYRNTGSDSRIASEAFGPRVDLAGLGRFNRSVALADVDGDGKLDIVTTVFAGGPGPNLFVFKNVSVPGILTSNSFAAPVSFHTGTGPQGVAVSDLDGDGKPDIIVANTDDDSIAVFRNTGQAGVIDTNSFTSIPVTFPAVDGVVSVVVTDLDRDGKPDIAALGGSTNVIAFRNVTAGPGIAGNSFSTGVNLAANGVGYSPMSMAVGDLDGDDRPEIVQLPYVSSGSRLAVLKNTSVPGGLTSNSFAPPVQFVTPASMWAVAIGDIDGDGKPDLVTTSEGAQSVRVMKNTSVPGSISGSSFASAVSLETCITPEAVVIGDLDGDGRPDLVVASAGSASLSLFWNTMSFSLPPSVVLVNPTNGSSFNTPATIELSASATDSDGTVTNVSFYFVGTNFIGGATNVPFNFTWNNVSAGNYSLTAVATDNSGLSATSAPPVNITVSAVNQPPLVSLTSPINGSVFAVGTNVTITANAADQGGSVTLVEFFAGPSLIGSDAISPYSLVWSNAPAGSFTLTARATDNLGAQATSQGVGVIITSFATNAPVFSWSNLVANVAEASPSVTLHLFKSVNSVAANIGYSTRDGSARAGGDVPDYVAVVSNLTFAAGETVRAVSIPILQDGLNESNHFFFVTLSPPTEGSITNGNEAQVVILDDDIPGTNSFLQSLPPSLPPSPLGSLRVNLSPSNIFAQWRLGWEVAWRDASSLVRGLPQGNYEIEFKPVAGYREPLSAVVPVLGGVTNNYAFVYPASQSSQVGSLLVTIQPSLVATAANVNERGQWRLQGEGSWRDSGGRIDGLPAGSHIVEFKQLTNTSPWVKPASLLVTVQANAESRPVGYYYVANTSPGEGPRLLDFENEIKLGLAPPYAFVGQILSDVGWGSGTVVKEKVVLTAAHVVFDDRELAYVPNYGVNWFFQRQAGVYEPGPQTPRGWIVQGGYAAQRTVEGTPGASAPASQELDIAALYFVGETAGRGGYSGYLVSGGDERINAALLATIAGYPVEGVPPAQVGQMHATPLKRLQWDTALAPHVFATTNVKAFPGNSGGPVFIQHTDAHWYPAAIFLGGSGKTVARVIDGAAATLIIAAEQASNTDENNTGGEPPVQPCLSCPPTGSFGYLDVYLQPSNIGTFGGGYRFRNTTNESPHAEGYQRYQLRGGVQVTLDFIPAAGHLAPLPVTASVQSSRTNTVVASYRAWGGVAMDGGLLRLMGSSGGVYRIDYKTNLNDAIWRSVRTQTFSGTGLNVTNLVPGATNGFFRAVLLP